MNGEKLSGKMSREADEGGEVGNSFADCASFARHAFAFCRKIFVPLCLCG
jgi:hypothetical protein